MASGLRKTCRKRLRLHKESKTLRALKAIPAGTLITEVGKNQIYNVKQITTVGFVCSIDEKNDNYIISLFGEQGILNPIHYIECRFPVTQENKLLKLDKGDRGKENFSGVCTCVHNYTVDN